MKSILYSLLILGIEDPLYVNAHRASGIFDRMVNKLDEKERLEAEFEVEHAKNLALAEKQAAIIS